MLSLLPGPLTLTPLTRDRVLPRLGGPLRPPWALEGPELP